MACVGSQFSDSLPASYPRGRRPALIPANCSLSAAETEELVRTRTQQPVFPPPDPHIFQNFELPSPPRSDSSISEREQSPSPNTKSTTTDGKRRPMTRGQRHRAENLKTRAQFAQYARGQTPQSDPAPDQETTSTNVAALPGKEGFSLRNHPAFVVDEELQLQLVARADTPHLSEVFDVLEDDNMLTRSLPTRPVTSVPDKDEMTKYYGFAWDIKAAGDGL